MDNSNLISELEYNVLQSNFLFLKHKYVLHNIEYNNNDLLIKLRCIKKNYDCVLCNTDHKNDLYLSVVVNKEVMLFCDYSELSHKLNYFNIEQVHSRIEYNYNETNLIMKNKISKIEKDAIKIYDQEKQLKSKYEVESDSDKSIIEYCQENKCKFFMLMRKVGYGKQNIIKSFVDSSNECDFHIMLCCRITLSIQLLYLYKDIYNVFYYKSFDNLKLRSIDKTKKTIIIITFESLYKISELINDKKYNYSIIIDESSTIFTDVLCSKIVMQRKSLNMSTLNKCLLKCKYAVFADTNIPHSIIKLVKELYFVDDKEIKLDVKYDYNKYSKDITIHNIINSDSVFSYVKSKIEKCMLRPKKFRIALSLVSRAMSNKYYFNMKQLYPNLEIVLCNGDNYFGVVHNKKKYIMKEYKKTIMKDINEFIKSIDTNLLFIYTSTMLVGINTTEEFDYNITFNQKSLRILCESNIFQIHNRIRNCDKNKIIIQYNKESFDTYDFTPSLFHNMKIENDFIKALINYSSTQKTQQMELYYFLYLLKNAEYTYKYNTYYLDTRFETQEKKNVLLNYNVEYDIHKIIMNYVYNDGHFYTIDKEEMLKDLKCTQDKIMIEKICELSYKKKDNLANAVRDVISGKGNIEQIKMLFDINHDKYETDDAIKNVFDCGELIKFVNSLATKYKNEITQTNKQDWLKDLQENPISKGIFPTHCFVERLRNLNAFKIYRSRKGDTCRGVYKIALFRT